MSTIADHAEFELDAARRAPKWPLARSAVVRALLTAIAIVLLQILFVETISLATGADRTRGLYDSFCRWDGNLYVQITERGYHGELPGSPVNFQKSNVAFFPGYPVAARGVHALAGGAISYRAAMVLTAQLAAWGFWSYWLLFLARWRTPSRLAALATLILALHPAAYFLVVAYSESLFLLAALGFLYWITSQSAWRWPLAAAHGFVMTATRMGGVPVALAPLAAQMLVDAVPSLEFACTAGRDACAPRWATVRLAVSEVIVSWRKDRKNLLSLAVLCGVSTLGVLTFFGYCQARFGAWNLYMLTQKAGWNLSADWFWWARPANYVFFASSWHPNVVWPDDLSRLSVLGTLVAFGLLVRAEIRAANTDDSHWQTRAVLYLAAAGLLFLHAAGVSPILMKSMIRYNFGVHALLLLAVVHLAIEQHWPLALSRRQFRWMLAALIALAGLQTAIAWRFFINEWVA